MGRKSNAKWTRRAEAVKGFLLPVIGGSKKKQKERQHEGLRLRKLFGSKPKFQRAWVTTHAE